VNEKEGRKSGAENRRSIGDAARPNENPFFTPDFLPICPDSGLLEPSVRLSMGTKREGKKI
jgi:hypothetical protein